MENKCPYLVNGEPRCTLEQRPSGSEKCGICLGCGNRAPGVLTFTPHTFDDICETPIHVTSKRQLKELCKVHNVRAARLM